MKIEHYKEPRAFKGFEAWFHTLQMTAKMHVTIILMIFILWFLLALFLFYVFEKKSFYLVLGAFSTFSPHLWLLALKYLFRSIFLYLIVLSPVWFLYPILLVKFKIKAQNIMRDEFLRGQKIISEEDLKKLIMKDLRKEFEEVKKR